MTDGYVSPSSAAGALRNAATMSLEDSLAKRFYQLNIRPRGPPGKECSPDPMHVWVVGGSGWLTQPCAHTDLLRGLHEDDPDDSYRILIAGCAWPNGCYVGSWQSYLRRAGMNRKKKHVNHRKFQEHGRLLLDLMAEHYHADHEAPHAILDRLGVPYAFSGSDGSKREE